MPFSGGVRMKGLKTAILALAILVVLAALLAACGTSGDGSGSTTTVPASTTVAPGSTTTVPDGNVVLTIEQALAAGQGQKVNVTGFVVATAEKMILCSALAESYPPQPGGATLTLKGLDLSALVGLSSTAGQEGLAEVSWSDYWVVLTGVIEDGVLSVEGTPRVVETSASGLKIRFSPVSEPISSGDTVWWAFDVTSTGQTSVTLTFSSGQRGDVSLSQGGAEKYRWSNGKAFTEAIETVTLEPGQSMPVVLNDTLVAPPGEYDLTATVTASVGELGAGTALPGLETTLTIH
jgi:hypothetical protein